MKQAAWPHIVVGVFSLMGALVVSVAVAEGATYYVSTHGSNTYTCTQARSEASPKLTLGSALTCLVAGDTLLVEAGVYPEALINNVPSGTSWANKVTIAARSGQTVWLRPNSGAERVVGFSQNQQYIEFDGINLDGANIAKDIVKIEVQAATSTSPARRAHHIRMQNAEITGPTLEPAAWATVGQHVLLTAHSDDNIGGNEFINLKVHGYGRNDSEHGFYVQSANNLIERCQIYDIAGAGVHLYDIDGDHHTNGNIIRYNIIRDFTNRIPGRKWGVVVSKGVGNQVYGNLIYNIAGTTLRGGIVVTGGATQTVIYNNTSVQNAGYGIWIDANAGTGTIVRNNITYQNATSNYLSQVTATGSNNLFEANPLFVNPLLANFQLQAASPAVDSGAAVAVVLSDIVGTPRPQGGSIDIGAFERHTLTTLPPAPPSNVRILSQ